MPRSALIVALSLLLGLTIFAAPDAPAQEVAPSATFGTASEVVSVVSAWEFEMTDEQSKARATLLGGAWNRSCAASNCFSFANLRLPVGAVVSRIELDGCDDSATAEIRFGLIRSVASPNGPDTEFLTFGTTGQAETPGCDKVVAPWPSRTSSTT
jgi:hypothetical protein